MKNSENNNVYEKIGFVLAHQSDPNYWYLDRNYNKRMHRFPFRKSELKKRLEVFDPVISEWENMKVNGYDRIWDCGNLKYIWSD